jgi:hypothetical protein
MSTGKDVLLKNYDTMAKNTVASSKITTEQFCVNCNKAHLEAFGLAKMPWR